MLGSRFPSRQQLFSVPANFCGVFRLLLSPPSSSEEGNLPAHSCTEARSSQATCPNPGHCGGCSGDDIYMPCQAEHVGEGLVSFGQCAQQMPENLFTRVEQGRGQEAQPFPGSESLAWAPGAFLPYAALPAPVPLHLPSVPTARSGCTLCLKTNFSSSTIWTEMMIWAMMISKSPGRQDKPP